VKVAAYRSTEDSRIEHTPPRLAHHDRRASTPAFGSRCSTLDTVENDRTGIFSG
jgi:hypothetical protein